MKIVFIPGTFRTAYDLEEWIQRLGDHEVLIAELPGHGRAPTIANQTVGAYIHYFSRTLPADAVIVGESLGGLIGLGLAAYGRRVIAIDPPLTMAKLWPQHHVLAKMIARFPNNARMAEFCANVFGYMPDGRIEERIYYDLLDRITGPVDILAGDVPLFPVHDDPGGQTILDEVDRYMIAKYPLITLHRMSGPHVLLSERPDACEAVIRSVIEKIGEPA